jgi:hypothetical protein
MKANLWQAGQDIKRWKQAPAIISPIEIWCLTSRHVSNNGILYGLPDKILAPLEWVQSMAARLVFDHATPLLRELRWLPIQARFCV